ncbi:protein RNA-directed DNA methylation 3 isoform X2 [Raphanus sativus]|uniref:Protein RNA-directed DNA methylation 3 isoform X2 n=1 Tax=Raphanus sativus TaxID=3726 RepID=A0A9W3C7E1_RAPSA|nr:protein RNA-directed DNA methylation 3 isoform X2 [Raphanus sativus]
MDRKGKGKQIAGSGSSSAGKKRKGGVEFRDEGLRINSKRKKPGVLQFFEESAEVGYYGGSSDEDCDVNDLFNDMEDEPELETSGKDDKAGKGSSSFVFPKEEDMNEDDFDRMMEERYKPGSGFVRYAADDVKSSIEMDALVPTAHDPPIWKIKCAIGREKHSVFCLMHKFVELRKIGTKLRILSVFFVEHIKGFIFIEADKEQDVLEACLSLNGIYATRMVLLPKSEAPHLLTVQRKTKTFSEGTWARIKSGKYKGDLAQVVAVSDTRGKALIKLIPRIDIAALTQKYGGGVAVQKGLNPAPRLISSSELEEFRPIIQVRRDRDTGMTFEHLDSLMLKDGFLYKKVSLDSLTSCGVKPSKEEMLKFTPLEEKETGDVEWISEIYGEEKKKKSIPTGKGGGKGEGSGGGKGEGSGLEKGEGSSESNSESSHDLYNLVCFSRKDFGLIVAVDDKGDGYKVLKEGSDGPVVVSVGKKELQEGPFDSKFSALDLNNKQVSISDVVKITKGPSEGKQGVVRQVYRGIIFFYVEGEEENGGYLCCKSQSCEKVKLFTEESNDKTGGFDASAFGDSASSPKSPLSPEKEWQPPKEKYINSNQGDKGSMYSIGQKLRIRVGPLKGYLCRVIGLRYSDITVKLDSQHKIFTVKSEHLAEVRDRNAVPSTSVDAGMGSFKQFDMLGTEGNNGDWAKGTGTSEDNTSTWGNTAAENKPDSSGDQSGGWNSWGKPAAPEASTVGAWGDASAPKGEASWGKEGASTSNVEDLGSWGKHGGSSDGNNKDDDSTWGKLVEESSQKKEESSWGKKTGSDSDLGKGNGESTWGNKDGNSSASNKDGVSWGKQDKGSDGNQGGSSWGKKDDGGSSWGKKNDSIKDDGGSSWGKKDDGGSTWGKKDEGGSSWGKKNDGIKDDGGSSWGKKDDGGSTWGKKNDSIKDDGGSSWGKKDDGGSTWGKKDEGGSSWGKKNDGIKDAGGSSWGKKDDGGSTWGKKDDGGSAWGNKVDEVIKDDGGSAWGQKVDATKDDGGSSWGKKVDDSSKDDGGSSWGKKVDGNNDDGGSSWGKKDDGGSSWGKKDDGKKVDSGSSWGNKDGGSSWAKKDDGGYSEQTFDRGGRGFGGRRGGGRRGGRDQFGRGRSFGHSEDNAPWSKPGGGGSSWGKDSDAGGGSSWSKQNNAGGGSGSSWNKANDSGGGSSWGKQNNSGGGGSTWGQESNAGSGSSWGKQASDGGGSSWGKKNDAGSGGGGSTWGQDNNAGGGSSWGKQGSDGGGSSWGKKNEAGGGGSSSWGQDTSAGGGSSWGKKSDASGGSSWGQQGDGGGSTWGKQNNDGGGGTSWSKEGDGGSKPWGEQSGGRGFGGRRGGGFRGGFRGGRSGRDGGRSFESSGWKRDNQENTTWKSNQSGGGGGSDWKKSWGEDSNTAKPSDSSSAGGNWGGWDTNSKKETNAGGGWGTDSKKETNAGGGWGTDSKKETNAGGGWGTDSKKETNAGDGDKPSNENKAAAWGTANVQENTGNSNDGWSKKSSDDVKTSGEADDNAWGGKTDAGTSSSSGSAWGTGAKKSGW